VPTIGGVGVHEPLLQPVGTLQSLQRKDVRGATFKKWKSEKQNSEDRDPVTMASAKRCSAV